jgi:hypothetical protein
MEQHYPAHKGAPILFWDAGWLLDAGVHRRIGDSANEQKRAVPVVSKREHKWFSSGSDMAIVGGFRKTHWKLD